MPSNIGYSTSKAAMIRMTGCIQAELALAGHRNIHLYTLHPGAVQTGMTENPYISSPLLGQFPNFEKDMKLWVSRFRDSPYLSGMTSVALASGIAKEVLRGRYYDSEHDLGDVLAQGEMGLKHPEYYTLGVRFPGGRPNDGGMERSG
ncbi:hypothetical protein N7449_004179 [Penicillium cf. viridicatum]|uniref:Uncharacterized protein n=1 Tax=Penicillium cf. viridicatum TaxID=2972119 RepID=A0A9W9MYA4_9EURO|nr:hypothetical protein N7449_004179 [Penicillium cf. viridicatum]